MSTTMMNRIWWREDLSMTEKFVAIALADRADDEGVCWPAVETLAIKCSCAQRTIQNAIKSLCSKGLLRRLERGNNSNYYLFNNAVLPVMEQPKRKKERHPLAEALTGESHNIDLFSTGESHATTGESHATTGESHATTGESPAPKTLRDTLRETSSSDSGYFKSPDVSLSTFIESEWKQLKADHPAISGLRKIDDALARTIALRAKQHARDGEDVFSVWRTVFAEIRNSRFLTGHAAPGPGRDASFKLSITWLCYQEKFREVINGRYSNERGDRAYDKSGNRMGPTGQAVAGTIERMRASRQRG